MKGIVEAHGGRFWAETELGHGTTFFMGLPVALMSDEEGGLATVTPRALPS